MVSKADKARANLAIETSVAQADGVLTLADRDGRKALAEMKRMLRKADRNLAKRLVALGFPGNERFSVAQTIAYQAQIRKILESLPDKLGAVTVGVGNAASRKGQDATVKLLATLEQAFTGVSIPPAVRAAMRASTVLRGREAVLVQRVATSFDRYGLAMGDQFADVIRQGLLEGATVDQMTASLVKHGGPRGIVSIAAREVAEGIVERIREDFIPEGLFVRHKYWAERIARTETAYAYNGAKLDTIHAMGDPDAKKKILATFDSRTAPDSVAVHGQIRDLDKPFQDGAGRVYMHPPARPNDRETVVAWFDDWPETDATRETPLAEREAAMAKAVPRAKPKPETVAPPAPEPKPEPKPVFEFVEHNFGSQSFAVVSDPRAEYGEDRLGSFQIETTAEGTKRYIVTDASAAEGRVAYGTAAEAAEHTARLGYAERARKAEIKAFEAKWDYVPGSAPETTVGALGLHADAQRIEASQLDRMRKNNVDDLAIRSESESDHDWSMKKLGYEREHEAFQNQWVGSSKGNRALTGIVLADDNLEFANAAAADLYLGQDVGERFTQYARAKHGSLQATLQRAQDLGLPISGMDSDGYVTVYRGLTGEQARKAKLARAAGDHVEIGVHSLSSWTSNRTAARQFSGETGVIVRARVHRSRFFGQYELDAPVMKRYGDREAEWILVEPAESITLQSSDIQNANLPE